MTEEAKVEEEKPQEEEQAGDSEENEAEDEELEKQEKLAFPVATVVRLMKKNLDKEKIIKKEVKIAMNKWLEKICTRVTREMNKFPYVTMSLNEFREGIKIYEDIEKFEKDKERILAHLDAIKKDIERLERDLGKTSDVF